MAETYYSIDTDQFYYLKFILEGYDNVAVLSSVSGQHGCVKLRCPAELLPELIDILTSIAPRIKRNSFC